MKEELLKKAIQGDNSEGVLLITIMLNLAQEE